MNRSPYYRSRSDPLDPEVANGGIGSLPDRAFSDPFNECLAWGSRWVRFIAERFHMQRVWLAQVDEDDLPVWVASYPGELQSPPSIMPGWEIKDLSIQGAEKDGIFLLTKARTPIGWLAVEGDSPQPIPQEVREGISALIPLMSGEFLHELERNRLYRAENRITLLLQSSLEIQSVLPQILEAMAEALEADVALSFSHSQSAGNRPLLATYSKEVEFLMEEYEALDADLGENSSSMDGRPALRYDFSTCPAHIRFIQRKTQVDFATYCILPLIGRNEPAGILEFLWKIQVVLTTLQEEFLERIARQIALAVERSTVVRDMRHASQGMMNGYNAMFEGLTRILGLRDHETEEHTLRVTRLTMRLVESLRIPPEQWGAIRRGALLHDIGKLGVPDAILLKPGSLSESERRMMQLHVIYGYNILSPISNAPQTLDIVLYHHEKWDGSGYPGKLRAEQIPQVARLFAVVDVYDALTTDRPYRTAWTQTKAVGYLKEQSGKHFDPKMVAAFLQVVGDDTDL